MRLLSFALALATAAEIQAVDAASPTYRADLQQRPNNPVVLTGLDRSHLVLAPDPPSALRSAPSSE